jgi:hypothetical protein
MLLSMGLVFKPAGLVYAFERVTLSPITHQTAELAVTSRDGSVTRDTPAQLEEFETYSLTTKTPWREEAATFEGILLHDLLAAHGLDEVGTIMIVAENDYVATMSLDVWRNASVLVATRVNGAAHSRRARGPIQLVFDYEVYEASDLLTQSHMVWMAAGIWVAD